MTRKELEKMFNENNYTELMSIINKYGKQKFTEGEDIYFNLTFNNWENLNYYGYLQDETSFEYLCDAIKDNEYNLDDFFLCDKDACMYSSNSLKTICEKVIGKDYINELLEFVNTKEK